MTSSRFAALAVVLISATLAPGAAAQPSPAAAATAPTDAKWTPWLGCWRAVDDPGSGGARVCIMPGDGGVTLRTMVGGQAVSDAPRVADGAPRPVREDGCTGTETARWSATGLRVYRTATAACGTEGPRTLAAVSFFVPGPEWIDVQTVRYGGAVNVRVVRYVRAASQRLADGSPVAQAPSGAGSGLVSRGWTTDEVVEASALLPPEGVQAAISEGPAAFRLNAASLTHLADGGVAENVIDLMVALTYPERFVIDRPGDWGGGFAPMGVMAGMMADPFFTPLIGPAALYDCYGNYGWASSSYWSRCAGYSSYNLGMYPGYFNGYYGGNGAYGAWIPVTVGPPGSDEAQGGGRVVNGRGYTQVRPIDTSIMGSQPGDRSNGGNSSGTSSSSGSPSGATSSGYSGGGGMSGGGDGGRTAVPRPPGA